MQTNPLNIQVLQDGEKALHQYMCKRNHLFSNQHAFSLGNISHCLISHQL